MSKQTFTTGQVLTAAQVNSLQSNDFNQTVSVKTAAYTLVAADKGTRVEFNTSGSVTVTVNTGLFDAGDTLVIQNRGAGAVTVTPGTATVNTSATLVLSQYDAGTLYFISASAAIFFNTDAGGGSPLTTKGDLYGFSTLDARIPIGANGTLLTADSNELLGLKWATGGGAMTLLSTTTLSTSSVTISNIDQTYETLRIIVFGVTNATSGSDMYIAPNAGTNDSYVAANYRNGGAFENGGTTGKYMMIYGDASKFSNADNIWIIEIDNYADTDKFKTTRINFGYDRNSDSARNYGDGGGYIDTTAAITSLVFSNNGALAFNSGTVLVYGVK